MHDYMFIIYGSNVLVFYFVKVYTFLNTESITLVVLFPFINVNTREGKKKKKKEPYVE